MEIFILKINNNNTVLDYNTESKLNWSISLLCNSDDISMCLWMGQISAVEQHFLMIASFLALKPYQSADSTIHIGLQSSCNPAEISWTQMPFKTVIVSNQLHNYSWLSFQVTHSTPLPVHLMKQVKCVTGLKLSLDVTGQQKSKVCMWFANIKQKPVSTHTHLQNILTIKLDENNSNIFAFSIKETHKL